METQTHSIHNFKPGEIFANRYRLLNRAGSGGFADVWQVEDTEVGGILALKIYARLDDDGKRELANEYRMLRDISHPNLLRSEHFGSEGSIFYLEMRYCDGGNLSGKSGKLDSAELRHVVRDICNGLAYLHQEGIVHQDIKPENILHDTVHSRYLLSDFGISSKTRSQMSKSVKMAESTISMTAAYAPPEKFSANPADRMPDAKGDIFSLGVTLYELATGLLPVDQPQSIGQLMLISEGRQPLYFDNIKDPLLRNIVRRCMSYRKEERPTAQGVLAMLEGKEPETSTRGNGQKPPTEKINVNGGSSVGNEPEKPRGTGEADNHNGSPKPNRTGIYIVVAVVAALLAAVLLLPKVKSVEEPDIPDTVVEAVEPMDAAEVEPVKEASVSTGTLTITSKPTGAAVKVDGKYKGDTPLTLEEQPKGNYSVVFSLEGYESATQSVRVAAGKTAKCHADLKKKQSESTVDNQQQPTQKTSQGVRMDGNTIVCTVDGTEYRYRMVYVSGGTYTMGCTSEQGDDCFGDEKPAHSVTVSGFYMGQTEVTQALWKAVMGSNPSNWKGNTLPVEQVSYNDVKEFIGKLNGLTGVTFRLPTEEEWEFAARGGNSSRGYKYSGSDNIGSVAWYEGYSGSKTHPVAQKRANELGLYDMSGNVWEWCSSLWSSDYSSSRSGSTRVRRGGSWDNYARICRVSIRYYDGPSGRSRSLGFRLAR